MFPREQPLVAAGSEAIQSVFLFSDGLDWPAATSDFLLSHGFQVVAVSTPGDTQRLPSGDASSPAIVISTQRLWGQSAAEVIDELKARGHLSIFAKLVLVSPQLTVDEAVEALRAQVSDVLPWPVDAYLLLAALHRARRAADRDVVHHRLLHQTGELVTTVQRLAEAMVLHDDVARANPERGAIALRPGRSMGSAKLHAHGIRRQFRKAIHARKLQRQIFGWDLVVTPHWDILLDLVDASYKGRPVSVSSLCVASGVPNTTALRRIRELEHMGLVRRTRDETDGRRIYISLDDRAIEKIVAYLEMLN